MLLLFGLVFFIPSQQVGTGKRLRNDLLILSSGALNRPQPDQSINQSTRVSGPCVEAGVAVPRSSRAVSCRRTPRSRAPAAACPPASRAEVRSDAVRSPGPAGPRSAPPAPPRPPTRCRRPATPRRTATSRRDWTPVPRWSSSSSTLCRLNWSERSLAHRCAGYRACRGLRGRDQNAEHLPPRGDICPT